MNVAPYTVRIADWPADEQRIRGIREAVFVIEQNIDHSLEWDNLDGQCTHALATDRAGADMGTARLLPNGQIGRMAVLASWRRRGVGTALLHILLDNARERRLAECFLNAQTAVIGFYQSQGFVAVGPEFMEAGIPHQRMVFGLSTQD